MLIAINLALLTALPGTLLPDTALADQHDKRLPDLFSRLAAAKSPAEASVTESIIWAIWAESGNNELDHLLNEGSAAMSVQDYATAMKDFDELTKRAPQFAEGWNKRATLYFLIGDMQASLADIDHTLELEPRHFGALAGLGLVNLTLDRDEAALDAFQRVLKIDPMNLPAKTNLKQVQEQIDNKSI